MDARMQSSQTIANEYQTWDYYVDGDIVPILTGSAEDQQAATIAAFTQVGTIPQLPSNGVPWVEFFTGTTAFNDVDGAIKSSLIAIGLSNYYPEYDLVNDQLACKVVQS